MLPLVLLCLAATTLAQQSTSTQHSTSTSGIESEEENANTQSAVYPLPQVQFNSYQPAAQQRRPTYTAPRAPETYSYMPYSFNYVAQGEDGSSSRQESSDASGRVVGSYTIQVEDGRRRVVDYVADHNGFRATIDTNEPGTDVQNPADVVFHSAAIDSRANYNNNQANVYRPPMTTYRQRPTRIYTQPAVLSPVVYRGEQPYSHYDNHGHDQHARHGGQSYAYYSDNNARYHWH